MDVKDLQALQADIEKKRLEIEKEIEDKKKRVEMELAAHRKVMEQKLSEQRAEMERRHQEQIKRINRQVNARELAAKIEAEFLAGKEQVEAKGKEENDPIISASGLTGDAEALMKSPATVVKPLHIEDAVEKGIAEAKQNSPVFLDGKFVKKEIPAKVPVEEVPSDDGQKPEAKGGVLQFFKGLLHRETPEEIAEDIAKKEAERVAAEEREKAEAEERLRKKEEDLKKAEAVAKDAELRREAERRVKEKAEKEAREKEKQERLAREKAKQEELERQEKEQREKEQQRKDAERERRRKEDEERLQSRKEEEERLAKEKAEEEAKKREKNIQNIFFRKKDDDQGDGSAEDDRQDSSADIEKEMQKKKEYPLWMSVSLFLIAAVILALTFFYGTVFVMRHIVGANDVGVVYPRTKVANDAGEIIEGVLTERINVLVMGTDYGDSEADKEEPKRTDAMILLSVDPEKKQVAVLSIPRDTKVILSGHRDPQKINAAYAFGGVMLAKQTVANLLGVPVTHYALADWQAFSRIVDIIGGVDITVEHDMKYDDPYANLHIDIKKGFQHLDGKMSAEYVRYRSDELGDIGRAKRQQLFIRSVVKQMFKVGNIVKIPSIMKTVSDCVETDMTFVTMLKVANSVKVFGEKNIKTGTLAGEYLDEDGVSYWQTDDEAIRKVLLELAIPSSKVK